MTSRDTRTSAIREEGELTCIPPSGDVGENIRHGDGLLRTGRPAASLVNLVLLVLATTVTNILLPPPVYDRGRETSSVVWPLRLQGRRISMKEARRLALAAMEKAERRRAEFAEREARLSAIWEEDE